MKFDQDKTFCDFKNGELTVFYREFYPGFVLYARRYLGKQDAGFAEDVVQDAILMTWQNIERIDNLASLKSYIYISIRNRVLNILRKRDYGNKYMESIARTEDFYHSIIEQELMNLYYYAVSKLPEKLQEVYRLSYLENMKVSEIAEKLHISERTVKQYRADILKFLHERVKHLILCIVNLSSNIQLTLTHLQQ